MLLYHLRYDSDLFGKLGACSSESGSCSEARVPGLCSGVLCEHAGVSCSFSETGHLLCRESFCDFPFSFNDF